MKAHAVALAAIFLCTLLAPAAAQEITGVTVEGNCGEFAVTVRAAALGDGCWDAKIDAPGTVLHEDEDLWRSSFFYVDKAICPPSGQTTLRFRPDSKAGNVTATARLRGAEVLARDFTITQGCPKPVPDVWPVLVAAIVILIFGYSLVWWWKGGDSMGAHHRPLRRRAGGR